MKKITIREMMDECGVAFGTSGARGLVTHMTDEVCYAYTKGFLSFVNEIGEGADRVAVSGDLRASTPRIKAAVFQAIIDMGMTPIDCGFIPTPALALYGFKNNIATVMVTGSHIPGDRNGIKFNKPSGELLKSEEARMLTQSVEIPSSIGHTKNENRLITDKQEAKKNYIKRYAELFGSKILHGLRVGVYQHSAVGRDALRDLLKQLGADVIELGRSESFIPVDTEAIRAEDVDFAKRWSSEYKLDAIVSTDGDSDRPLFADENGVWLKGDILGIICSKILGIKNIAIPVSCNTAAEKSGYFTNIIRTKIGSPYVIDALASYFAQDLVMPLDGGYAGFEANGGYILGLDIEFNGKKLEALETRDAFLPIFALLAQSKLENRPVSSFVQELPQRFTSSGLVKNVPNDIGNLICSRFEEDAHSFISSALSDLRVVSVNIIDGTRATFEDEVVIHLRQSGNAPELRCYVESEDTDKSAFILEKCLHILADTIEKIKGEADAK